MSFGGLFPLLKYKYSVRNSEFIGNYLEYDGIWVLGYCGYLKATVESRVRPPAAPGSNTGLPAVSRQENHKTEYQTVTFMLN